jgi:rare lipoprotein A
MLKNSILLLFLSLCIFAKAQDTAAPAKKNGKVLYGIASFYSDSFDGKKTASGETFRQKAFTAASNNIPLNTWVKVTNLKNKKTVIVKINDRMAPSMARKGRVVDLTRAAAQQLSFTQSGLTRVKVEILGKKKPV